ncbi:MAG: radical SAM family heme chaperone HemW [Eubacterium sp.]|nr:radical SAM family heme chaperone HemW [Eubacterium sp.]
MDKKKLEIYIHIPFCVKKCDYCDFLSMRTDENAKREYVSALVREIELSREKMKDYLVDTVFIGGGTPSILNGKLIENIMKTLRENSTISEDAEITIECNPGTVTREKLQSYRNAGINRISFGLQSANDEELKNIGRIHNYEQFEESFRLARAEGYDNINIDIMSALPGQSVESYVQTLDKVIQLQPEHISAYSLIVEEDTPLNERVQEAADKGMDILPDEETEREMYYLTERKLNEAGFHRYEISNYSKAGYECRHNIGYWKRVEYLGFGLGAASLYQDTRYNNTYDIDKYIGLLLDGRDEKNYYGGNDFFHDDIWNITEDALSVLEGKIQRLTRKDMMEEFMFLGLRMIGGISVKEFEKKFGRSYDSVYGEVTEKLITHGLIEKNENNVRLTKRGVDVSNYAMSQFLL